VCRRNRGSNVTYCAEFDIAFDNATYAVEVDMTRLEVTTGIL